MFEKLFKSARDWIRTSTPFPAPPPQGGASTNFATRALEVANLADKLISKKVKSQKSKEDAIFLYAY